MSYETLQVDIAQHVAHVQLNRPDAFNAMNVAFWRELPAAVRALDATGETRVIVLSSTGKHFTAGMDLSVFAGGGVTPVATKEVGRQREALRRTVLELQEAFTVLERVRMPVIAAIQGGCIGGGVDMVTACDMRFCTRDAFFCVQEINIGMTADVGTLQRLPKIIASGPARELAYSGRRMPAARAREVGLVNEVYDDQPAMLRAVMELAKEIAERSPLAITGTKEMLNFTRDHSVEDSLRYMAAWQTGMFQPADMFEAFAAKQEKRTPAFENLTAVRSFGGEPESK